MKLIHGDCLDKMKDIEDNSIDLTVTSPPYFNAREYSHWESYQTYLAWLEDVFKGVYRVTKAGRMCCVNISPVIQARENRHSESTRFPLPFDLVPIMRGIGFKFIDDIIWVKPSGSAKNRNGRFSLDRNPVAYKPNVVTEYIIVFQKPIKGLIDDVIRKVDKNIIEKSKVTGAYEKTNVWYINPETKSLHPAPFPETIPDNLIRYYSYIEDTVFDPFTGSGTTGKMAILNNRNFIGIELNEEYFKIAKKRINAAVTEKQSRLF